MNARRKADAPALDVDGILGQLTNVNRVHVACHGSLPAPKAHTEGGSGGGLPAGISAVGCVGAAVWGHSRVAQTLVWGPAARYCCQGHTPHSRCPSPPCPPQRPAARSGRQADVAGGARELLQRGHVLSGAPLALLRLAASLLRGRHAPVWPAHVRRRMTQAAPSGHAAVDPLPFLICCTINQRPQRLRQKAEYVQDGIRSDMGPNRQTDAALFLVIERLHHTVERAMS